MNKTAIKSFAIWARRKLISDITYKAGMLGVTEKGIAQPMQQSTSDLQFFDIGTKDYVEVSGAEIMQRKALVSAIREKEKTTDYQTAFRSVIEEVAYTWFNRLIAIRFMEVNDYLPAHIRVLSSENPDKLEPDFVTNPFDTDLEFDPYEKDVILQMKEQNKLDELFRMLFIKQCNKLKGILPGLFEQISDYTEILLTISFTDKDGVVYHLTHDISEDNFNVSKEGQVEIIGWLYQYYNTEPKNEVFAKSGKITKEDIPAVTQLFTPDWIVRYMVENSLGRLWVEGHPNNLLRTKWKYYLEEAEQEPKVQSKLGEIHKEHGRLNPEDIHFIDPCMGSGHILVYAFDVLIQIYESVGYSKRDAAKSILENNLYGLDIDERAYQIAYFAVMMKARQYNRRILSSETVCHVYSIQDSNSINRALLKYFGLGLNEVEKNDALNQIGGLLDTFRDAKEYGSLLNVGNYNWNLLRRFIEGTDVEGQITLDFVGLPKTQEEIRQLVDIGETMARKYEVVSTNPPYMSSSNMDAKLNEYLKKNYSAGKNDLFSAFILKGKKLCEKNGYLSMITMHSWMFLSRYEELRSNVMNYTITNMLHLGARAFEEISGEVVQTVSFVLQNNSDDDYIGRYVRVVEEDTASDKEKNMHCENHQYYCKQKSFRFIVDNIFAYWAEKGIRYHFEHTKLLGDSADCRQGIATGDNDQFLRLWSEVAFSKICLNAKSQDDMNASGKLYAPYNKGGAFRRWYGNNDYVIKIDEINYNKLLSMGNHLPSRHRYYMHGITWNDVSTALFCARLVNDGFVFDAAGPTCFYSGNESYLIGLLNSKVTQAFLNIICQGLHYSTGHIPNIPFILQNERIVDSIANDNVVMSREDWDLRENSWNYKKHPLSRGETIGRLIADKYKEWEAECDNRFNQLKAYEEELNRIFIDIYGLQDELTPDVEDKDVTVSKADLQRDIKSLISYAVGCMFGRYSLDNPGLVYAGGEWDDSKYNTFIPDADNCIPITDEEYFKDDIVGRFMEFVRVVYGKETLEENLEFIAEALGSGGKTPRETIRQYFIKDFFKDHCQTYSVTGSGKRPIYWLFDSGKQNGFKALVYMHRWNADTVGNVRVEYLHKMQQVYEKEIASCQDIIDSDVNSREIAMATKRMEKFVKQLKECKEYDAKIAHIALSRIDIDLDDGVKVNYRKVQTGSDGRFCEILADSKDIMVKEDSSIWQNLISNR